MRPEHARERAEALFRRKEEARIEGTTAMAEYKARQQALREKTARLRALRLRLQIRTEHSLLPLFERWHLCRTQAG